MYFVKVERTSKGLTNRVVTGPDNIATPTNSTETGGSASSSATGMTASYTKASHPLFGGQVPLISSKVTSPAGLVRTEDNTFTFSAVNPSDAMTYTFTDIKSVNGAQFKSIYERAAKKSRRAG